MYHFNFPCITIRRWFRAFADGVRRRRCGAGGGSPRGFGPDRHSAGYPTTLLGCVRTLQTASDSPASKSALLTLDQKTRISELITARTPPLGGPSFPVAVDGVVPPDIQLNSLPSEAEDVAPQLRGLRYIVVEELVAIVDPRTRKVEIVFPRWGK